jgi:hypothetical protein
MAQKLITNNKVLNNNDHLLSNTSKQYKLDSDKSYNNNNYSTSYGQTSSSSSSSSSSEKGNDYDDSSVKSTNYDLNIQKLTTENQTAKETAKKEFHKCDSEVEDSTADYFEEDLNRLSNDLELLQSNKEKTLRKELQKYNEETKESFEKSDNEEMKCVDLLQRVIQLQDLRKKISKHINQTTQQEDELKIRLNVIRKEKDVLLKEIKEVDRISKNIRLSIVQHIGIEEIESKKIRLYSLVKELRDYECSLD